MEFSRNFVCETYDKCTRQKHVPAPVFRKSFTLKNKPSRAQILICGLGFYDLFVNGKKITKGLIAPYVSNPDDFIYYDSYDLAPYLEAGENVIGVILGNGHQNPMEFVWNFYTAPYASSPKLALSFKAENGAETVSFDATEFKCTASEIYFDNYRTGAFVDARKIEAGRFEKGFDDSHWHAPLTAEQPRGYAKLCEAEPIRIVEERKPVSVRAGEMAEILPDERRDGFVKQWGLPEEEPPEITGGYIYDFGVNDAGIMRLKIKGKPGQKISLQCAEWMTDGKVDTNNLEYFTFIGYSQRDIYICKGEGEEIFEPPFTYHGYRYIYVTGITEEQATEDLLTYLVAHSDLEERGSFSCSDPDATALYEMAHRSDLSNFYYFPTDCPRREKNGWTGDASMSAEHMILTIGAEKSWRDWLNNIRAAQRSNGMLPGIVPTTGHRGWGYNWGSGPTWDAVLFNLPWFTYLYRGETEVIEENAHAMLRYLEYVSRQRDERGLVNLGLGDWVPTGSKTGGYGYKTPVEYTDSASVYEMCVRGEKMFNAVGLTHHTAFAKALGAEFKAAIRKQLVNLNTMTVRCTTITAQAMFMYYGIFEPAERERAYAVLKRLLIAKDKTWEFGMLGLRTVFHLLTEFGDANWAYELICRRTFPSYGMLLEMGETTITEKIVDFGNAPGSHNHHFLADFKHWFMRTILGINVNPSETDANTMLVSPHFIKKLDHAEGWHKLPAGRVDIAWKRTSADEVELTLKCEPGVKAYLSLLPEYVITGGYEYNSDGTYPETENGAAFTVKIKIMA